MRGGAGEKKMVEKEDKYDGHRAGEKYGERGDEQKTKATRKIDGGIWRYKT